MILRDSYQQKLLITEYFTTKIVVDIENLRLLVYNNYHIFNDY